MPVPPSSSIPKNMRRKPFATKKRAGAHTRFIHRPSPRGTSKFVRRCVRLWAMTTESCWIRLGHMTTPTPCGLGEPPRRWTFTGTKTHSPMTTSMAISKLKQDLRIPLMATEMPNTGPKAYAPWIMNNATDYLRGGRCHQGRPYLFA